MDLGLLLVSANLKVWTCLGRFLNVKVGNEWTGMGQVGTSFESWRYETYLGYYT